MIVIPWYFFVIVAVGTASLCIDYLFASAAAYRWLSLREWMLAC